MYPYKGKEIMKRKRSVSDAVFFYKLFGVVLIALLSFCFVSCNLNKSKTPKSDNEMINSRISEFLSAYNDGDFEATVNCFDKKTRRQINATFNVTGSLLGSVTGVNIDLSDMFSLGIATSSEDDFLSIEISRIVMQSSEKATLIGTMSFSGVGSEQSDTVFIVMVKESDDWYINDITDENKDELETGNMNIILTDRGSFKDGYAFVSYEQNGKNYHGILNTDGKIIYSTPSKNTTKYRWQNLGNEHFIVNDSEQEGLKIINSSGMTTYETVECTLCGEECPPRYEGVALGQKGYFCEDCYTEINQMYE